MATPPAGTETLPYTYTTRKEIESCFSQVGVALRIEDDFSDLGPNDILEDVINEATDEVNMYLERRYYPEHMAANRWVRRSASWIAAYLLSQRRGNPKQMVGRYNKTVEQLQRCYDGELNVPRLRWRAGFSPEHFNLVVDSRYPDPPQKVSAYNSRTIGWY